MRGRRLDLALLAAIVVVAVVLRLHDFDRIPYPNETADEYAFTWAGWSWLHEGAPTSWSWKPAYGEGRRVFANGTLYQLVTPWLDHPPLYSLLVGAVASLGSIREMLDVSLRPGRALSVVFGSLSAGLLLLLARARYGRSVAALAGLLFAVVPTVVLANRLVVAEALTTPLLLVGLLAAERGRTWMAFGAAVLAPMAKVPGVSVGLAVGAYCGGTRRWAPAVGAAVVGLVPYVAYGLLAAPNIFRDLLADQSGRSSGIEVLPFLLTGASTGPVSWRDAWIPFLWLAVGYAAFRRDRLVAALVVPYLVVMVAIVDQSVPRVWYREPLFPGLCLAGALLLHRALTRPNAIAAALVVFGLAFGKLAEGFNAWQLIGPAGQRVFPVVVLALGAPMLLGWRRVIRWEIAVGLAFALMGSLGQVWSAEQLYPKPETSRYEEVALPTLAGVSIRRYFAEPDVLPPAATVHASVVWGAGGDPRPRESQIVLRLGDAIVSRGTVIPVESPPAQDITLEYHVTAPSAPPNADYEVGIQIGGDVVPLGVVRVRTR